MAVVLSLMVVVLILALFSAANSISTGSIVVKIAVLALL